MCYEQHSPSDGRCGLDLSLAFVDFDPSSDAIQWRWRLIDDRLPTGETFLHVSTDRCGWNMRCHHSTVDGLGWDEVDAMDGAGLPVEVDDGDLEFELVAAMRRELVRVDLVRLLLCFYPPAPFKAFKRVAA